MELEQKYQLLDEASVKVSEKLGCKTSYGNSGTLDYILVPVGFEEDAINFLKANYNMFTFTEHLDLENGSIVIRVEEV